MEENLKSERLKMESYKNTEIYQFRKELSFCQYLNFQIPITMKLWCNPFIF